MATFREEKVAHYYERLLDKHKDGERAVDWGEPGSQDLGFAELMLVSDELDNSSVLDIGCGLGDLYAFFQNKGLKVDYTGYDITPGLIESAKKKYPSGKFEVKNILKDPVRGKFDYVFMSGTLGIKVDNHPEFVKHFLKKAYDLCVKALAFNVLSVYAFEENPAYQRDQIRFYADPAELFKFCKEFCKKVVLNHDFQSSTFSIFMYKDYSRAISQAHKIIVLNPPIFDLNAKKIVRYYFNLGFYPDLLKLLENFNPTVEVLNLKADCYTKLNKVPQAQELLELALKKDELYEPTLIKLGSIYTAKNEYGKAEDIYKAGLKINKSNLEIIEPLVILFIKMGKFEEAQQFIAEIKDSLVSLYLKGELHLAFKKYNEALNYFQQVRALAPNYAAAHEKIAEIYAKLNNYQEAAKFYQKALTITPHDNYLKVELCQCYIKLDRFEDLASEVFTIDEETAAAYFLKGTVAFRLKDYPAAKNYFGQAKKLNPSLKGVDEYLKKISKIMSGSR